MLAIPVNSTTAIFYIDSDACMGRYPILFAATNQNGSPELGVITVYNYGKSVGYYQVASTFSKTTSIALDGNKITLTFAYTGVYGSAILIGNKVLNMRSTE